MAAAPDPEIGQAATRNKAFATAFTRGRILAEAVGPDALTVLDVGAYTGETAAWFADLFPQATIWAVEPFPDSYAALAAAGHPRVRPFQFAATDAEGTATLFANAIPHTNSLYPINPESRDSVDISRRREQGVLDEAQLLSSVDVPAHRLDEFADGQGIGAIDLLKIDVQGAEVDVLRGSSGILGRVGVIMIEISLYDYYTSSSSIGAVEELIRPYGFALWSITDTSHNPMNGRTDWVELLYRKPQSGGS